MRYSEILEDQRGKRSGHLLTNTGQIGELEDALCQWVEGDCIEAAPHIMALAHLCANYRHDLPLTLYRGFIVDDRKALDDACREGLTIKHHYKTLESWSKSPEEVDRFMAGWDRPWVMISCPTHQLNVLIDLQEFSEQERPHTRMHDQEEVIVIAKPIAHYNPEMISCVHTDEEIERYFR